MSSLDFKLNGILHILIAQICIFSFGGQHSIYLVFDAYNLDGITYW